MPRDVHYLKMIGEYRKAWGPILSLSATVDNASYALVTEPRPGIEHVYYRDMLMAQDGGGQTAHARLSYDGERLAVIKTTAADRRTTVVVEVNGAVLHTIPNMAARDIAWLEDGRLVWSCDEVHDGRIGGSRIHFFLDGRDMGDALEFQWTLDGNGQYLLRMREGDTVYQLAPDGSRTWTANPPARTCPSEWHLHAASSRLQRNSAMPPKILEDKKDGKVRVSYRGAAGPAFDAIARRSSKSTFCANDDASAIAYVGVRLTDGGARLQRTKAALERLEKKPGRVAKLASWPHLLFFHPEFGLGHFAIERSRRYFPVNHDRAWAKGYRSVINLFYTPASTLVAHCETDHGECVAIDEREGPLFERIANVRPLGTGGLISYLALDRGMVLRGVAGSARAATMPTLF